MLAVGIFKTRSLAMGDHISQLGIEILLGLFISDPYYLNSEVRLDADLGLMEGIVLSKRDISTIAGKLTVPSVTIFVGSPEALPSLG